MADRDVSIGVRVTGAQAAANEIQRTEQAVERLDAAEINSTTVNQRSAQSLASVTAEVRNLSEASVRLDPSPVERFGDEIQRTKTTGGQFGNKITQIGYQIQDFAVQTAAGTSAVRAFSQQAPQLLSAFGPWGVVAGTAVAVAVPLAAALFNVGESAAKAGKKVEDMAEDIAKANKILIDRITSGVAEAVEQQIKLRIKTEEIAAAERAAAESSLTSDEKVRQSKIKILEALGFQVDKYKEIEEAEKAAQAKAQAAYQTQVAQEQARLQKAEREKADAQALVEAEQQNFAALTAAKIKAEKQLNELYAERARLLAASQKKVSFLEEPAGGIKTDEVRIAKKKLENPVFQVGIKDLEDQVAQLQDQLTSYEGPKGKLREANVKLEEAINTQNVESEKVSINLARLEEEFAANDFATRTDAIVKSQEEQAKGLKDAVSEIETTNAAGAAAKETLLSLAADGKITADEAAKLSQSSAQMIAQMQAHQATAGQNTETIIQILKSIRDSAMQNQRELQTLRTQFEQINKPLR